MRSILIADAGSTKIDWALLRGGNEETLLASTEGVNALTANEDKMVSVFDNARTALGNASVQEVHYFGAGCATPEICRRTENILTQCFEADNASASSDLTGAARALFGSDPGIACILGTGSNSGLYNGIEITDNVPTLGFILDDRGSGAALGKRLLSDAFKRRLPESIIREFLNYSGLTKADVLDKVYRQPAPNKFLASLSPFLKQNISEPHIRSLVLQEFECFLKLNVLMYPNAHTLPVSFTGSISYHFSDILREAAANLDLSVGSILRAPLQGLTEYYKQKI